MGKGNKARLVWDQPDVGRQGFAVSVRLPAVRQTRRASPSLMSGGARLGAVTRSAVKGTATLCSGDSRSPRRRDNLEDLWLGEPPRPEGLHDRERHGNQRLELDQHDD